MHIMHLLYAHPFEHGHGSYILYINIATLYASAILQKRKTFSARAVGNVYADLRPRKYTIR